MKMDFKNAARCGSGRVGFEFTICPSLEGNSFVRSFKMFIKLKQFPDKQIMKDKSIRVIINKTTGILLNWFYLKGDCQELCKVSDGEKASTS